MKGTGSKSVNDWAARQLQGTAPPPPKWADERRGRQDRRRRFLWSVCYGSFNPRRRRPPRRLDDSRFHPLDWHAAHLLGVAVGILLLSAADAFFSAILLLHGADEVNPVMSMLFYRSIAIFTALKMGMTGACILLMVFLARYHFMRVIRVEIILYLVLAAYAWLILYEIGMLKVTQDLPIL